MKRVKYIYVIGVEGCGHHGFFPMISASIREFMRQEYSCNDFSPVAGRWPPLRELFNRLWYQPALTADERKAALSSLDTVMRQVEQRALATDTTHYIIEDNSFPSAGYRSTAVQWDIQEMKSIMSVYADIYYIALYRDPIAMTFSHPELDGGIRKHAAVLACFLEYLDYQLRQLGAGQYLTVHYEDMMAKDTALLSRLSAYLEVPRRYFQHGLDRLHASNKDWRNQLPPDEKQWLMEFFDHEKRSRWPAFEPFMMRAKCRAE